MKLFLAGVESKHRIIEELYIGGQRRAEMQLYIAGVAPWRECGMYDDSIIMNKPYILESFYYADSATERLLPYYGDFLLDSGAFTFMSSNGGKTNWEEYIERYANFVKKNNVKKYFELDIDSIVGFQNVLKYRKKLEILTGRQPIPVWHKSRGFAQFEKDCIEYPYVAIGGIVTKEIKPEHYRIFPKLISTAHKHNAKIHGLGFTSLTGITQYHFDSVDSTAWTTGNRFGHVYQFNGKTMTKHDAPHGKRIANQRAVAVNNFVEWIKFQKYVDAHL